uniref:Tudor domain-containing protein n=1 Tax=Clastoptera arizonana TaxID=38151 RepID=A0A1B6CRF5_9HEMI
MIFNDDSSINSIEVELTKLILECDKISNGITLIKSHATKRVEEIYSMKNVKAQNMKISEFCIKLKEIGHLFKKTNTELELLLRMNTSEKISFNLTNSLKTTLKYHAGTDPWNFWLQEQNYLTEIEEINNIFLDKYQNNKLNNYNSLPKIGEFVCFLERRRISRGMVTQHLGADRLMIVNIDTSSYKVLNQDQVYKVDADISILHAQAIKCSLCEDIESCTMWSSELGNIFSSILRDAKLEVKVCKQLSDHPPHFLVDIVIKSEGVKDLNVSQWICQIVIPELKQKYVEGVELCHLLSAKALDPYYEEDLDLDVKTSDGFRVTEDINAKHNTLVPIVRPPRHDNATNQPVASDIQAKSSITKDKVTCADKNISSQAFASVEKTGDSISINLTHDLNDLIIKVQNSDELRTNNMYCGQTEEYNECKEMNYMNEHTLTRECGIKQSVYEHKEKRLSNGYVIQNESNNKAEVDLENTFSTKLFIHDHQKDMSVEHQNPTTSNSIQPDSVLQGAQKQEHHYQKPLNSQNQFLNDKNNYPGTTLNRNKRVVSPEFCKSEKEMSHINNQFSNDENNQSHITVINQIEESTLIEIYANNQLPSNFVSTKEEMITNQFSFSTKKDSEDNHIILKRSTYNSLEIFGIMIAHVVTPSDFYVHIANENNANIDWLKEEMYAYYSSIKQNESTHRENVKKMCGTYCACKWPEDENWYRAEVLDWNKDGLVSVFFVDYGNQDVVPLCNIQPLVKKFGNLEIMAQACHLAEIKPISDSWTAAAIECFSKFITDKTIYRLNTVPSKSDKTSWALRIFLDEKIDEIDTINDLMVSYGHALNVVNGVRTTSLEKSNQNNSVGSSEYNGEDWDEFDPLAEDFYSSQNCYNIDREDAHTAVTGYKDKDISNVCKFFAKEGKCWKKVCYKKHILESDLTQINMYKEAFEDLPLPNSGALIKLRLVDICSIEKFYVQIEDYVGDDESKTLVSLINKMNSVKSFRSMKPLDAPPIVGQIVIVLSSNKNWFRSRVLEYCSETKSVLVQHVDFGTKENVNERNLCQIEPKYLHLPFQAVECNMANISQHADESKNKKAVMILENFLGRMLNASVYNSFPGMNRLEVFLLDKDNQDIGNFLLKKKLCMPKLLSNPAFENE